MSHRDDSHEPSDSAYRSVSSGAHSTHEDAHLGMRPNVVAKPAGGVPCEVSEGLLGGRG